MNALEAPWWAWLLSFIFTVWVQESVRQYIRDFYEHREKMARIRSNALAAKLLEREGQNG